MLNEPNDFAALPDMELFFQTSADLLCIAGMDGYFKKVNPMVSKTLGYTDKELLSRPIDDFVYDEDKEDTALRRQRLKEEIPLFNFENRYVAKDESIIWLSWTSVPVKNQPFIFAIAKNITHKKQLEEDRNKLVTQLSKLNKELKQTAYTMAHDLRSPANNLVTGLELIDMESVRDKDFNELFAILKYSAKALTLALDQSLATLIEKENTDVPIESLSLTNVFNKVLQQLKSIIQDTKTTITADFSRVDNVLFNKSYLKSVFLNLITNSIKYALPDKSPIISVSTNMVNNTCQLTFSDQGQGFDMAKTKNKIFGFNQHFHEYKDSKGIGLYLVYNHITSLGGHIEIDSSINEGATFTITFKT